MEATRHPRRVLRRIFAFLRADASTSSTPLAQDPQSHGTRHQRFGAKLVGRRLLPLYIGLAVNALFVVAYLWSAGGATTHVRISAADSVYTVFVDGKKQVEARCEQFSGGAVVVRLPPGYESSALPEPRGLDRLVVTDVDSKRVLLDDSFLKLSDSRWITTGDRWHILTLGDISWHNYTVDAYFKNPAQASIMVHSMEPNNGIVYSFRPFRHFDNGLDFVKNGKAEKCPITWLSGGQNGLKAVGDASVPSVELAKSETLKSMVAMTVHSYPFMVIAVCALLIMVVILQWAGIEGRLRRLRPSRVSAPEGVLIYLIAVAAFGVLVYIARNVNQGMPHVPDEVSYVFQAKILASFHLTAPIPPVRDAFEFFYPSLLVDSGGRWASIYPFGHPMMLAIGQLAGAVWMVPPILGALSIVLIYAVGKRIHGTQVGIIAAALLAFSPFFQMTASNLMSHNTAVFYILACLFLITVNWRSKSLSYGLAGVCFGLLLNTRPLTATALVPPFALLFLHDLVSDRGQRAAILRRSVAFAAGVLLMVGALYLYSLGTTGSLDTGYGANTNLETVIGFGEKNSVARGMQNEQVQLAALLPILNGWPLIVGLAFLFLPFTLGSRSHWDVFLLAGALFAIGIWTAYESSGLMHGPRYWYEAMPFLMLLAARGLVLLGERVAYWASLMRRSTNTREEPIVLARALSCGLLAVLLGMSVHGWMLGRHYETGWADYVPRTISELKGFNGADDRLLRKAQEMDLHNALVLVKTCGSWQCYGTVFWRNAWDFNGDIIYARDVPQMRTPEALARYSGRQVYLADYGKGTIVPYDLPLGPLRPTAGD